VDPDGPETVFVNEEALRPPVGWEPRRLWVTEIMRAVLGLLFAVFLLIVIVWGFIKTSQGEEVWAQTKELLELVFPAITALLGSAVGFYFGTQKVQ
jgi:hypothetical protein